MHNHRRGRKLFERLRKDDSKLETEQCLSPGRTTRASVSICSILARRGMFDRSWDSPLVIARSRWPTWSLRTRGKPYHKPIAVPAATIPAAALAVSPKIPRL
jgi:hypothetical protein